MPFPGFLLALAGLAWLALLFGIAIYGERHPSVLARRWGLAPLTDRDRAAPDFTSVVGLRDSPRPDSPTFVPREYTPLPVDAALAAAPSSLHRDVVGLASAVHGIEASALSTLGEAVEHLRRLRRFL